VTDAYGAWRTLKEALTWTAPGILACNVGPHAYLLHVLKGLPQREPDADISDSLPFDFAKRSVIANEV
jgi:hypothetical protein